MQVSFKIVQMVGDRIVVTYPTDIEAWARINNRRITGFNDNPRQRIELQGQPRISGFCGPMYDSHVNGGAVIRYEDSASNDILSR
jgi:hypothetical protein